ncbi:hypothetical protein EDB83DRAFT_2326588 [Lactarius deliciosus]|nr:hypothetical protein EDB83DRAFT_2326588 [Lactarius deliciosus]
MPPTPNVDFAPPSENKCSQSKCKVVLAAGYQYKTCEKCRSVSRLGMQRKRKREQTDENLHHRDPPAITAPGSSNLEEKGTESDVEQTNLYKHVPVKFEDKGAIMKQLKSVFKSADRVFFHGLYNSPLDPLTSEKDHIKATAYDIWKVTGYRFT